MKRAAIVLFCSLLAPTAVASEARIPIATPTTIDDPGHYFVVRDLTSPAGSVITINTSDVILDLGGHTLTLAAASGRPLLITADASEITIRNGRLRGGENGLERFDAGQRAVIRLEDLEIEAAVQFGILLQELEYVEIVRCRVTGPLTWNGITLSGGTAAFGGRIIGNVVENTSGYGISLKGLKGGEVRDNRVFGAGGNGTTDGLNLWSDTGWEAGGNRVSGNIVRGSGGGGLLVSGAVPANTVTGNTITDSAAEGIRIYSDGNLLTGNLASANGGHGYLFLGSHGLIRDNHAAGNGGDGFRVSSLYNLIEDDTAEGNVGYGLYFVGAGSNAYRSNMLRGNSAGAVGGDVNTDAGGNVQ